uniref:Uncharacterized protein n=1 Tax=Rhizophora mucronata TaxID=61149 RepID=A0A2P2LH38_RHIMU
MIHQILHLLETKTISLELKPKVWQSVDKTLLQRYHNIDYCGTMNYRIAYEFDPNIHRVVLRYKLGLINLNIYL